MIDTPYLHFCMLQVVGLEPKLAMWQYAESNARDAGFTFMSSEEGNQDTAARATLMDTSDGGGKGGSEEARGHYRPRLRMVRGTAEAMPFADGEFDAVVCTLVRGGSTISRPPVLPGTKMPPKGYR